MCIYINIYIKYNIKYIVLLYNNYTLFIITYMVIYIHTYTWLLKKYCHCQFFLSFTSGIPNRIINNWSNEIKCLRNKREVSSTSF